MRRMATTAVLGLVLLVSLVCDDGTVTSATQASPVSAGAALPRQLQSLNEARSAVGFPMALPTVLLAGYRLDRIEHVTGDASNAASADRLIIIYRSSIDHVLRFEQGWSVAPDTEVYRFAPDD